MQKAYSPLDVKCVGRFLQSVVRGVQHHLALVRVSTLQPLLVQCICGGVRLGPVRRQGLVTCFQLACPLPRRHSVLRSHLRASVQTACATTVDISVLSKLQSSIPKTGNTWLVGSTTLELITSPAGVQSSVSPMTFLKCLCSNAR